MKGAIFNAFFEMVEQQMGDEMLEKVVEGANLPHLGSYTAAGNYPDTEMNALLLQLHEKTNLAIPSLLEAFGKFTFGYLYRHYHHFFEGVTDAFELLGSVHDYIHVEVKKLYPDAILPAFTVEERNAEKLVLLYESPRAMGDLARGMIQATMEHYNEEFSLQEECPTGDKRVIRFTITRL